MAKFLARTDPSIRLRAYRLPRAMGKSSLLKYAARVIEKNEQPGSTWGLRVGVFRVEESAEEQVGEYHRNYSALFNTLCPFQIAGLDYALYSPEYHITRVMELPTCKDLGGEDPQQEGFCPTDYYVPSYVEVEATNPMDGSSYRRRQNEPSDDFLDDRKTSWVHPVTKQTMESWTHPLISRLYYPFGFVAGCVWGDDSSWKIQYLDLSDAQRGVIRRDDRFGYIELPDRMRLRDAIDMEDYMYDGKSSEIRIAVLKSFDVITGHDRSREAP